MRAAAQTKATFAQMLRMPYALAIGSTTNVATEFTVL
jgi:hypothetical protein